MMNLNFIKKKFPFKISVVINTKIKYFSIKDNQRFQKTNLTSIKKEERIINNYKNVKTTLESRRDQDNQEENKEVDFDSYEILEIIKKSSYSLIMLSSGCGFVGVFYPIFSFQYTNLLLLSLKICNSVMVLNFGTLLGFQIKTFNPSKLSKNSFFLIIFTIIAMSLGIGNFYLIETLNELHVPFYIVP